MLSVGGPRGQYGPSLLQSDPTMFGRDAGEATAALIPTAVIPVTDGRAASRYAAAMPDGTRHELTGLLVATPAKLVLKLQDGRQWTLAAPAGIDRFIDRKVRVSGVRGEDGVLLVDTYARAG